MENQHRKIKGYRELDQNDLNAMNEIKEFGVTLGTLIDQLERDGADPRWLEIGKTDLQKGMMFLTRSIAKPDFF